MFVGHGYRYFFYGWHLSKNLFVSHVSGVLEVSLFRVDPYQGFLSPYSQQDITIVSLLTELWNRCWTSKMLHSHVKRCFFFLLDLAIPLSSLKIKSFNFTCVQVLVCVYRFNMLLKESHLFFFFFWQWANQVIYKTTYYNLHQANWDSS